MKGGTVSKETAKNYDKKISNRNFTLQSLF